MSDNYEKQAAGANGLGVNNRFPWQGAVAPSGSWQLPNLSAQQQQPNIFQQQLTPPAAKADVAGIQGALQKFRKMGAFKASIDKEALGALSPLVTGLLSGAGSTAGSMLVSEAIKKLLGSKKPTAKPTLSKQAFDALRNYQKQYPKYNWADHADNLKSVRAPYEGWSGAWKGIKGFYAPGQMSSEKREAVQNYLSGKNKQYPLPKGSRPWHMRDTGDRTIAGFHVGSFEPTKPKPRVSGGPNLSMGRQLSASEPDISLPPQGTPPTVAREAPLSAKDLTPPPFASPSDAPAVRAPVPSVKPVLNSGAGIPASTGKAVGQLMKGVSGGSAGAAKLPNSAFSNKRSFDETVLRGLYKRAIHVEKGGPISRWTGATLGRLNPLNLFNLILSRRAYHNPEVGDRFEKHKELAETIERGAPKDSLKDTVLRLGGGNIIDDMIWKKERGKSLPWYSQLGGRIGHNKRTSIVGKLLGYLSNPVQSLNAPLGRGAYYDPLSDTATNYIDERAITGHELGHAIDFNTIGGKTVGQKDDKTGKVPHSFFQRQGKGAIRDLYMAAYGVPAALVPGGGATKLWHEAQANIKSRDALIKALKDNPKKLRELIKERARVLPAGYGSYVGGAIPIPSIALPGGVQLGPGQLAGMIAGRISGEAAAEDPEYIESVMRGGKEAPANKLKELGQLAKAANNRGLIMNDAKFRNLMDKHAEQDNSTDSRSAVGESKITYKTNEDDHATGTDAWDSLSTYMKSANETFAVPDGVKLACDNTGLTPYQLAFAVRVHEANLSPQQIIDGVEKIAEYMGEEYAEEIRDGLDKIASLDKDANWGKVLGWGTKALKGLGWLGGKAKKPVDAVGKLVRKAPKPKMSPTQSAFSGKAPVPTNPSRVAETANRIFEPAKAIKAPTPAGRTGKVKDFLSGGEIGQTASKINPSLPLGPLGGQGKGVGAGFGGAMRMAGGAYTGDEMTRGALGQDAPWWARAGGALTGAAYGRAMPNMGTGARAAGNRAWLGMAGGEAGDIATRTLGLGDHNLSSYGALGGFASPLMRGQNVPGTFGKVRFPQLASANASKGNALAKAVVDKVGPRAGNLMRRGAYAAPVVGATAPIAGAALDSAGASIGGYAKDKIEGAKKQFGNLAMDMFMSSDQGKNLSEGMERLNGLEKEFGPMLRKAKPLLEKAESFGGLADMFGGVQEGIDGLFDMVGMGEFTKDMNPIMKIMLLAGAGLSLHGLLSGNKGTGIGGLGAMAIPLIAQMVMRQRKQARGEAGAGQTGAGGGVGSSTTAIDAQSQKDQLINQEQARHAQQQALDAARQPEQWQGIPYRQPGQ